MKSQEDIEKTRKQLFGMQTEIEKANDGMALMGSNEPAKMAIDKCIEMCNYFLEATQKFEIPFDNVPENNGDDEDDFDE